MEIPLPPAGQPFPVNYGRDITVEISSLRVHEMALQRFFNATFQVAEGYPVPFVIATPTDAFSTFKRLFNDPSGPFQYLFDLKTSDGQAAYRVTPDSLIYPLISAQRKSWTPRPSQSWGTKQFRGAAYLTTGSNVSRNDLAVTMSTAMPTAWDFSFNIEHYCRRAETHASFIKKLMRAFRWMGGVPQTWIPVKYPGFFGKDHELIRIYLSGDITDLSEPTGDAINIFRCGFTVVIEGYDVDLNVELNPSLWKQTFNFQETISPNLLETIYSTSEDIRMSGTNVVFNALPHLPNP